MSDPEDHPGTDPAHDARTSADTERSARSTRSARRRVDLGAVAVFTALGAMFVAVPRVVTEEMDGSVGMAGFAVSIFFVAAVVTRPFAGRFIDRHGRRPLLATLPFVLAVAVAALVVVDSVAGVLALRFVQGMAGGAFYVVAVTVSTDLVAPNRRAGAVARLSIAIYAGFALGPVAGERLVDLGATMTWLVLAGVIVAGGVVVRTIPETRPATVPLAAGDPPPGPVPWLHPVAVLPGLALLTLGVGYTSVTGLSALYARSIDLGSSDLLFITFALTILVLRLGSGRLADAVGPATVMFPGMAASALGFTLLALGGDPVSAVAGVALVGVGWAVVFPAVTAWVAGQVPDGQRGAALGTLVAFMDIGQGSGGYIVGSVAGAHGFEWAFVVPGSMAVVGAGALALALARARQAGG
ncbi:MAG: MFS transporter [Acidimicrobiia bacterium]|nr:MFS transporter [Acidimicrobiia bacterium]